ncbi:hypothetical protein KNE206_41920 [Kitasatospora sp. NE20-6]
MPADAVSLSFDERPWGDETLLHAGWIPPISSNYGGGLPSAWWSSVRITVAPTLGIERAAARKVLREHALPELRDWVDGARQAPEAWALTRHSISWGLVDRGLARRHDQEPYQQVKLH